MDCVVPKIDVRGILSRQVVVVVVVDPSFPVVFDVVRMEKEDDTVDDVDDDDNRDDGALDIYGPVVPL
jgi:hypothetical protein